MPQLPEDAESVTRRWASAPSGSADGASGPSPGHQVTTGVSGTSSGMTTESGCRLIGPYMRSSTVCPAAPSPDLISASSRDGPPAPRLITASIRHGCSRPAWVAARIASCWRDSSVMMIRLSTTPVVGPPSWSLALVRAPRTSPVVVSVRSMIIRGLLPVRSDYSRRQARPSRASSASAPGGPCVPAGYCSGLSWLAQNSSTGSRISQDSSTSSWRGNSGGSPMSTSSSSRS